LYGVGIDGIIIIQSSHVEVIFRVMERRLSQKRGGRVFFWRRKGVDRKLWMWSIDAEIPGRAQLKRPGNNLMVSRIEQLPRSGKRDRLSASLSL